MKTKLLGAIVGMASCVASALPPPLPRVNLAITPQGQTLPWSIQPTWNIAMSGPCADVQAHAGSSVAITGIGSTIALANRTVPATSCAADGTATAVMPMPLLAHYGPMGSAVYAARIGTSVSPPAAFGWTPDVTFPVAGGTLRAAIAKPPAPAAASCNRVRIEPFTDRETSAYAPPPPHLRTPYETMAFTLADCGGATLTHVAVGLPETIPPGSAIWVADAHAAGQWRPASPCLPGCPPPVFPEPVSVGISVADAWAPIVGTPTAFTAAFAVAFPQPDARPFPLQDLWWTGPSENGWGMNIAKNGERMFVTLFVYDADGKPLWAVMPSGQWDPQTNVYWGDLYIPTGAPFSAYSAARFNAGLPVGTASVSFTTEDVGHLDYTINGVSGGKRIERYVFGNRAVEAAFAGMWWGGASQDGWGLSVQQQGDIVFATWYTYGADGNVTWFSLPAAVKTGAGKYAGKLYRTSGARWAGVKNYDASRTTTTEVGTMELTFTDANAGTMKAVVNGATITQPISRFGF